MGLKKSMSLEEFKKLYGAKDLENQKEKESENSDVISFRKKDLIFRQDKKGFINMISIDGDKVQKKVLTLTDNDFRNIIKSRGFETIRGYNRNDYLNSELENTQTPPMNYIYYKFVFDNGKPPTQKEFIDSYIDTYCDKLEDGKFKFKDGDFAPGLVLDDIRPLEGRLSRAINSYHRELDMFLQFCEFSDVRPEWSYKMDYVSGLDCKLYKDDVVYYVASYLNNENSNTYKQDYKNAKRHDYTKFKMIDLKSSMADNFESDNLNGVYLHSSDYIRAMLDLCTYEDDYSVQLKKVQDEASKKGLSTESTEELDGVSK